MRKAVSSSVSSTASKPAEKTAVSADLRKIRVLFLNTAEFFGPVMQVHSQVMKHLDPRVYRVYVATNSRGDTAERLRSFDGVTVKEYYLGGSLRNTEGLGRKIHRAASNIPVVANFFKLARFIRSERIEIIHSASQPRALLLSSLLSLATGGKLVVHVHEKHYKRLSPMGLATIFGFRRAAAVIIVSRFMAKNVAPFCSDGARVHPVHNVVDIERFRPGLDGSEIRHVYGIGPQAPVLAMVGRVIVEKGQHDLLKALLALQERHPDLKAFIVGWDSTARLPDGRTYRESLDAFCREHGLDDHVIFTGTRPDVEKFYTAADVVVVPSVYEEPFGLVVIKAMAMGKPLVATRSGGIPEIVEDDKTGLLVPRSDPEALAKAILRLLDDPELCERLGRQARASVEERFAEPRLARQVEEVYQGLLS